MSSCFVYTLHWKVYRGKSKLVQPQRSQPWLSLLTIIMSSKRPSETNRIRKIAGSVKGKLSSFLHSSRAPTAPSIETSSSSDNATLARWVIWMLFSNILLKHSFVHLRFSPLDATSADHALTTRFATEAHQSSEPAISVAVPKQLGSATDRGLETSSKVGDYSAPTIVVINYWSFSICLQSAGVHFRPLYLIPSSKKRN